MNGRLKLKGRVFTHLIYPCIMSVVLFVVGIWITVIDSDAGSVILSLAVVYLIFTIVMYVVNQKLVMQELIKFAVDYAQVQKELLDDMVIPYGLIEQGRGIFCGRMAKCHICCGVNTGNVCRKCLRKLQVNIWNWAMR